MKIESPAWYCARTKPKHEHIAAANLRKNLNLEVFHPRLRMERATRRGVMRVSEPLFPCYIFFRCLIEEKLGEIQRTSGISTVVHFARRIPKIADAVIEELKECFEGEETLTVEDRLSPGDEVVVVDGAFCGMRAFVLRVMPARKRVQVLLDVLGRPTPAEVDENSVVNEAKYSSDLGADFGGPHCEKSCSCWCQLKLPLKRFPIMGTRQLWKTGQRIKGEMRVGWNCFQRTSAELCFKISLSGWSSSVSVFSYF